jgi:hypothetical protein
VSNYLLTDAANYSVVQLPGRQFPGVLFQGDSIHGLGAQVTGTLAAARKYSDEDLTAELEDALETLSSVENKWLLLR